MQRLPRYQELHFWRWLRSPPTRLPHQDADATRKDHSLGNAAAERHRGTQAMERKARARSESQNYYQATFHRSNETHDSLSQLICEGSCRLETSEPQSLLALVPCHSSLAPPRRSLGQGGFHVTVSIHCAGGLDFICVASLSSALRQRAGARECRASQNPRLPRRQRSDAAFQHPQADW
jgi:hypothetical protein